MRVCVCGCVCVCARACMCVCARARACFSRSIRSNRIVNQMRRRRSRKPKKTVSATYTWQPDTPPRLPQNSGSRAFSKEPPDSRAVTARSHCTPPRPAGCCLALIRTLPSRMHAPLHCNVITRQSYVRHFLKQDVAPPRTPPSLRHAPLHCIVITKQGYVMRYVIQQDVASP